MSDGVIAEYAGRLRALSEKENLSPFDRGAFAAMLEYGVRKAGRRNKVTARFVDIADLAREAHYAARGCGRESGARGARAGRAVFEDGAAQPDRDAHSRNDRRGNAARRCGWGARRAGEWVERAGDWRVFVWEAGADHGDRGAGQDRDHQHRARIEFERAVSRQRRAHYLRIFAEPVCAGQAVVAVGEHLLRAIVFGSGWGQRELDGNVCAGVGAFGNCRCGRILR